MVVCQASNGRNMKNSIFFSLRNFEVKKINTLQNPHMVTTKYQLLRFLGCVNNF